MPDATLDFELHRRRLDNGLDVVVAPDPSLPIVGVNLWYGVGSRNEREGKTGFAHLFEHMMFQGSKHVPKNGHFDLVERAGGSLNASTSFDRTNYFETLPSHHLDLALWLESDRLGFMLPAMTQEKLDNQRDVVKNEKRQRYDNQPYGDWLERLLGLVWPSDHPYTHTVIGSMEDIDAATLDDVSDFFATFYVPNNAVLTVAGDVEVEHAFDRVEHWFGGIARGEEVPAIPGNLEIPIPMAAPQRVEVVSDVPLARTFVGYRIPPVTDPAFAAVDLVAQLLGSGRSSRLYRDLVRTGKVRDAFAYAFPLSGGASMLLLGATGLPDADPAELETLLTDSAAGVVEVEPAELDRALALEEARLAQSLEHLGTRADRISMNTQTFDRPERVTEELAELRAVTLDQVRAAGERWVAHPDRAVVTYIPEAG